MVKNQTHPQNAPGENSDNVKIYYAVYLLKSMCLNVRDSFLG